MITLAIETSCDETGVAVVESNADYRHKVLTNTTATQLKTHAPYGGVVPTLAAREHTKNLPVVTEKTLNTFFESKKTKEIDRIAYTNEPGLPPALLSGRIFAKSLGLAWNKPALPVNHMDGHLYSFLLDPTLEDKDDIFPMVALIVSGGHTQLYVLEDLRTKRILGQTTDDAAGEAFDKVGRLLGLPYPGGPAIEKASEKGDPQAFAFPRPMLDKANYDFSFAGLKTAVLYTVRELEKDNKAIKNKLQADLAASFQEAVLDVLVKKTSRATHEFSASSVVLAGGVAANKTLRSRLQKELEQLAPQPHFFIPPFEFCTDNASMIGVAAYFADIDDRG